MNKRTKEINAIAEIEEIPVKEACVLWKTLDPFKRENYLAIHNVRGGVGKKTKVSSKGSCCSISTYSAPSNPRRKLWKDVGVMDIVYCSHGGYRCVSGEEIFWLTEETEKALNYLVTRSRHDFARVPYYIKNSLAQSQIP